jgi:hypothetical protein
MEIQVNTTGMESTTNPDYQFTALVQNYRLIWFSVELLFPDQVYHSLQEDVTGNIYVNNPSAPVTVETYPVFNGDLLTELQGVVYVNGDYNQTVPITVPVHDTNYSGYDDEANPWAYQNTLTGDPGANNDATVNFLAGQGYFYSWEDGSGLKVDTACIPNMGTVEDSNMYYVNPPSCYYGEYCTQDFEVPSSGGGSAVTVEAVDQDGNPLTGYYIQLDFTNGTQMTGNYTAVYFDDWTAYNSEYMVYANSYSRCTFSNWSGGGGNPDYFYSQAQVLTAVYNCSGGEEPNITVQSVNQENQAITGYYTQLDSLSYVEIDHGYTAYTYGSSDFTAGDGYYVYADSYGDCTFTQWSTGSTAMPLEVTAAGTQTFTAEYDCT